MNQKYCGNWIGLFVIWNSKVVIVFVIDDSNFGMGFFGIIIVLCKFMYLCC